MRHILIEGDPMEPQSTDLIVQINTAPVGARIADGWRVLTGNARESQIARVAYRYEIEEGAKA
jgi:hypothetical protein